VTQNQIINQFNIFFSAALCGMPLPVSLLTVPVSLNFLAACKCYFLSIICLEIHLLTLPLYIPLTDTHFLSKSYLCRWKPYVEILQWHLQWCNSDALVAEVVEQHNLVVGNIMYLLLQI